MPPRSPTAVTPYLLHPWHGVTPGEHAPGLVTVYVEMVPGDTVKYEVDKRSGHLMLDRPQKYSSQCPAPYGFIPQTYCGTQIADFAAQRAGKRQRRARRWRSAGHLRAHRAHDQPGRHPGDRAPDRRLSHVRRGRGGRQDRRRAARRRGLRRAARYQRLRAHAHRSLAALLSDLQGHAAGGPGERAGHLARLQSTERAPRRVEITDIYDAQEAEQVIRLALADYQAEICAGRLRGRRVIHPPEALEVHNFRRRPPWRRANDLIGSGVSFILAAHEPVPALFGSDVHQSPWMPRWRSPAGCPC